MQSAPKRDDEAKALAALHALEVLDTAPEPEFDALVRVASLVCGVPISLVSLIDTDRQWFKANVGLPGATQTPRDLAFCAHAVLGEELFEVPDATQDPRFLDNPLVASQPDIRFYAGAPITLTDGSRVGTLCVIDRKPGQLNDTQRETLRHLATAVAKALENRRDMRAMTQSAKTGLHQAQTLTEAIDQHSLVSMADPAGNITYVNELFCQVSGYSREELIGQNHRIVKSDEQPDSFWAAMWKTISAGQIWHEVVCNRSKSGAPYWADTLISPFVSDNGIEKYISILTDVTASKMAAQALSAERERLANIITGTHAGTWEWNVATGEILINDRWAEMLGYTRAELTPLNMKTWGQLCHPGDWKQSQATLKLHFSGSLDYFDQEFRIRHRNGQWIWVHSRGQITSRTPQGLPASMSGTHQDISKEKQVERLMRIVINRFPGVLAYWDAETRCTLANDAYIGWMGKRPEQMIGHTQHELFGDAVFERNRPHVLAVLRGEPQRLERSRIQPDGSTFHYTLDFIPDLEDGRVIGFISVVLDITHMKTVQLELEAQSARALRLSQESLEQKELLDGLIQDLPFGVVVFDPNQQLVLHNKAFKTILGYPDELLARPALNYRDLIQFNVERGDNPGQTWEEVHAKFGQMMRSRQIVSVQRQQHDGKWIDVHGKPLPSGSTLVTYADVSEQKNHEVILSEARRTAELATAAKGTFLANMSHEIRTPMNAILGMLKLLHNTELTPRQLDYVNKTEGASKSLLSLINDILDFSKIDAGKMVLDPQPFALDAVLRDLSVIVSANVGNKPVEFLFDIDPATPVTLVGDALRLQQVLINLSGNAIKFTAKGEVIVQIKVLDRSPEHCTLRFSVRDSGIGIAPENQKHIFSGFSQAEASTTRQFGGTGLGLSISKRLVGLMGGELALDSLLGQGSTFYFTITLAQAPAAASLESVAQDDVTDDTAPVHVLVVDDNPIARELTVAMGQQCGWLVDAAQDGAQAIAAVQVRAKAGESPYQAIFVDWQMPGLDGWDTALRIRELHADGTSPLIVMVTAHGREMLSQRTAEEQARLDGFLVKPLTASMLRDSLTQARSRHGDERKQLRPNAQMERSLVGMRLLVVEDNMINQQVAEELLNSQGAQVYLAANGQLGVEAVMSAKPRFDAVLMDVQMPVMDGYAATKVIREQLGMVDLPIIAMTANAMSSDRDACLAAGMNDHIGKPFDLASLVATLVKLTGWTDAKRRQPADIPAAHPAQTLQEPHDLQVSGLDVEGALSRMGGSAALYLKIVKSFVKDTATMPEQLARHLDRNEQLESVRLMHTLKGLAATLGATQLASAAAQAEAAIKSGDIPGGAEQLIQRVRGATDASLSALATLVQKMEPPAASTVASRNDQSRPHLPVLPALQELHALLANSDMDALRVHAELLDTRGAQTGDTLDALNEAMSNLDFARAAAECKKLLDFELST